MLKYRAAASLLLALFCSVANGQTKSASPLVSDIAAVPLVRDCSLITLQTTLSLTFKQRVCLAGAELLTPQFALRAAFMSTFGQYANSPHVPRQRLDELPYRMGVYYARRATRDAAEVLVGYFHHEDPRFRKSLSNRVWQRTSSALMNVLASPDSDGHLRPAYAPVAGSLSSAFVGSIMYKHQETLEQTLAHAAAVYGFYFARSVFLEFKPDLSAVTRHLLHRDN